MREQGLGLGDLGEGAHFMLRYYSFSPPRQSEGWQAGQRGW